MIRRAEPIHAVVDSVLDRFVPILFRKGVFVIDDVAD